MLKLSPGVNCTMLAPYTKNDSIDLYALAGMIDWYSKKGCRSLFAMCHSTELHLLTMEERLKIIRGARENADKLASSGRPKMNVIAAGSFSTSKNLQEMADQMKQVRDAGAEAVVIITNRLDPDNELGDTLIQNAEKLLQLLPDDMSLGFYECPLPYKRILQDRELQWAVDSKRICFLKDTCCDPVMLHRRMELIRGSELLLFNANAQTLLMTLKEGAAGYSSIMANITPELYVWLCDNFNRFPEKAEHIQHVACFASFSESLAYPLIAKYVMRKQGVPIEINSRMRPATDFKPYDAVIMDQLLDWVQEELSALNADISLS